MANENLKQSIASTLARFANGRLADNARDLFNVLGYRSDKTMRLASSSPQTFIAQFKGNRALNEKNAWLAEWTSADLIFQLTSAEVAHTGQRALFEGDRRVDDKIIESYVFLAIGLRGEQYSRTQLATITREVNKIFPMPALVLFKHGPTLTLAVIDRRLHKRDESKDVLEKVTLIKDIRLANPHRAHIEILCDLSLDELRENFEITNWVQLHEAWRATLDTSELNKKFFREVANWYFWAQSKVKFPRGAGKNDSERNAISVIRLLTRLIFVWFVKEKNLVPDDLFDKRHVDELLKYDDPKDSTYYKAILQNLFFGTLNTEMGAREFRHQTKAGGRADDYMTHNRYRYAKYFKNADAFLKLCAPVPFLNGGLFECLDKSEDERVDGFSDRPDNELVVPDELFFGEERTVDLSNVYGDTKRKRERVRGLIETFDHYKFTVDENTPIEEEIALDPELLGKVFENLLAAYNPETGVTARKQTGSFYTPREIVNYMVDESLKAYLQNLTGLGDLSGLLAYNAEPNPFSETDTARLVAAIDQLKALDPACGSGAFPMGLLHKLVYLLRKLDPDNVRWKQLQITRANAVEALRADIDDAFANDADYARKLYLIENCLYGVDIQPIAVQICKLRCFISLIVDDKVDDAKPNRGIRPLPNLETKFVAANSLIGIEKPAQMVLRNPAIDEKEKELAEARKKHFSARTRKTKEQYRALDTKLRAEIGALLRADGFARETTEKLAAWNPYDQNTAAEFFDAEWMFDLRDGFDVVIGNPPYVNIKNQEEKIKLHIKAYYQFSGGADIYVAFIEKAIGLLKTNATLAYIVPNKFFGADYGKGLRDFLNNGVAEIASIWDLKDERVFESALISTIVILIRKKRTGVKPILIQGESSREVDQLFDRDGKIQIEADNEANSIINKMNWHKPLADYAEVRTGVMGFEYWKMSEIITEGNPTSTKLKLYVNGNFERYKSLWGIKTVNLYKDTFVNPVIRLDGAYLNENTISLFRETPKIIVRGVSKRLAGTIDIEGAGLLVAVHAVVPRNGNWQYLLGLINSDLLNWYHLNTQYSIRIPEGSLKYPISFLKSIPVAQATKDQQTPIIKLVDRILAAKRKDAEVDTSALEREIDALVYQLYGLTEAEIRVVEGK